MRTLGWILAVMMVLIGWLSFEAYAQSTAGLPVSDSVATTHETPYTPRVFLWVDQGSNSRRFQSSQDVYNTLLAAKEAGITAIALDVRGIEGYVSYLQNDLTGRPHVSAITSPTRAGASPDLDLLAEFIHHGHRLGMEVHAALNAFAEGSIAHNAFAVLDRYPEWEEVIYRPEDEGQMLRLRDSTYGRREALVAFINPGHPEARAYQLRTFEEVIKNYDVDGVIIDRGRYDNVFADFSDLSRRQFEEYLRQRGKVLQQWPDDVFTYRGSTRIDGPLINDWYTFRAGIIQEFIAELRRLVDRYNGQEGRNVELSAYVGSWYPTYYLNGANWASPNFVYDQRLAFPQPSLYAQGYAATSFLPYLDFLMIGTYQSTASEVARYISIGNTVTGGEIPLIAGMALANIGDPTVQRDVIQTGLTHADGLMLFDLVQANFPMIKASIAGDVYVLDYQVGVSNPQDWADFIQLDFLNVNRNEGTANLYTEAYGPTTNTSTWGVEVIVDAKGRVIRVVNKYQAMFWAWTGVELNNSLIPAGGFVISAEDPSGPREKRQLIAGAFRYGDEVRAAVLSGVQGYDGLEINGERVYLTGRALVVGPGTGEVQVNGEPVAIEEDGYFGTWVTLVPGVNAIDVVVLVDGLTTNRMVVEVRRG